MKQASSLGLFSSLASAIIAFCNLFKNLVSVSEDGVEMAAASVRSARSRQAVDLAIGDASYFKTVTTQAALKAAKEEDSLTQYTGGDAEKAKSLQAKLDHYDQVVKKTLAEIAAQKT